MRDLCKIFEDMERNSGVYQPHEPEDTGLPFYKVLEIAEQDDDDESQYDE